MDEKNRQKIIEIIKSVMEIDISTLDENIKFSLFMIFSLDT